MDDAGHGGREHPRSETRMRRHEGPSTVRPHDGFVTLMEDRRESIVDGTGPPAARHFLQQYPMGGWKSAVHPDHAVDKRLEAARPGEPPVGRAFEDREHLIEMLPPHGLDQRELVGKVLVERADADSGHLGYGVSGESVPAALPENVSRGLQDGGGGRAGTRLLRLFAHRARAAGNASNGSYRLRHNVSIVLVFFRRIERPYRARDLPICLAARFLTEAAALAQSVAIGWTVYLRSHSPLALGLVGLAQFAPMALLTLPAGEICDRLGSRRILAAGLALQALCASGFLVLAREVALPLWPLLILSGAARAFAEPASAALLPLLLPGERLPRALALSSALWQLAVIAGPALGGLAYARGAASAYGACAGAFLAAALGVAATSGRPLAPADRGTFAERLVRVAEGVRFVRSQPILLGAITLDLIAVLLGGASALLPVYARDILHAGPIGLGFLRSAPAVGACATALYQVRHPPERAVGKMLFAAVAAFGIATIVFALSTSFALSLAALIGAGAADMVSVNIRSSLVQLATPDALRGRVSAVNMLLIGTSGELGAFESGLLASLIGTVPCVLGGGIGAVLAAVLWMRLFPTLKRADRFTLNS